MNMLPAAVPGAAQLEQLVLDVTLIALAASVVVLTLRVLVALSGPPGAALLKGPAGRPEVTVTPL
jgi:hypothetical protein